jgi:hypothetical protein
MDSFILINNGMDSFINQQIMIHLFNCSELSEETKQGIGYVFCSDTLLAKFIYDTLNIQGMNMLLLSSKEKAQPEVFHYESIRQANHLPTLKYEDENVDTFDWIVCHLCKSREFKISHRVSIDKTKM